MTVLAARAQEGSTCATVLFVVNLETKNKSHAAHACQRQTVTQLLQRHWLNTVKFSSQHTAVDSRLIAAIESHATPTKTFSSLGNVLHPQPQEVIVLTAQETS